MNIYIDTLGCAKNEYDSQMLAASLLERGCELTDAPDNADIIIVNTCGFIEDAKRESINRILELADAAGKNDNSCDAGIRLVVTGCLAEKYHEDLEKELPEVDMFFGVNDYDNLPDILMREESVKDRVGSCLDDLRYRKRVIPEGSHYAYLKIAEGCSKHCTYCIIPKLRGNYRSVPMEELLVEAEQLSKEGTKELIVIAQETTVYGVDLYGEKRLPKLLHELCKIDGIEWVRLLYCYPEEITEELVQTIKTEKKICHYLDLPIQHCNDDILKRMGRKTTQADLREKISMLRKEIPDIALRTTLISGFPGETNENHEECVDFVANMKFERLGVFPYSPEEGTPAAGYDRQLPEEIKQEWADEIMQTERNVIFAQNEEMIGRRLSVIVDRRFSNRRRWRLCRAYLP